MKTKEIVTLQKDIADFKLFDKYMFVTKKVSDHHFQNRNVRHIKIFFFYNNFKTDFLVVVERFLIFYIYIFLILK